MKLKGFFKNLWSDERGQSTTEYILILAVVVMVAMQVKKRLPTAVMKVFTNVENSLNEATTMDINQ